MRSQPADIQPHASSTLSQGLETIKPGTGWHTRFGHSSRMMTNFVMPRTKQAQPAVATSGTPPELRILFPASCSTPKTRSQP